MPSTFDELEAKGFKFVTVSELIRMAAARPSHPSPQRAERLRRAPRDPLLRLPRWCLRQLVGWRLRFLLLCGAKAAICHPLIVLTTCEDKVIIFAVASPRTRGHITNFDKCQSSRRLAPVPGNRERPEKRPKPAPWLRFGLDARCQRRTENDQSETDRNPPLRITGAVAFTNPNPAVPAY